MAAKKKQTNVIELTKGKPRQEEERFSDRFSGIQINVVLLLILSATFLVQGVVRYMEVIQKISYLHSWFVLILMSIIFLTSSVVSISLGGVVAPLKLKRDINMLSFTTFILGFILFLLSLIFLLMLFVFVF